VLPQTNYALSVADAERRTDVQRIEATAQRAELERRAEAFRFTEAVRLSEGACGARHCCCCCIPPIIASASNGCCCCCCFFLAYRFSCLYLFVLVASSFLVRFSPSQPHLFISASLGIGSCLPLPLPFVSLSSAVERKSLDERLCESVRALTEQSETEDKRLAVHSPSLVFHSPLLLFPSSSLFSFTSSFLSSYSVSRVSLCFDCLQFHFISISPFSTINIFSYSFFSSSSSSSFSASSYSSSSPPPPQSEIAATNHALAESNVVRTQEVNRLDALIGQNETERQREDKRLDEQHKALVDVVENSVKPAHAALVVRMDAAEMEVANLWEHIGSTFFQC
jgi:hypothetical protein